MQDILSSTFTKFNPELVPSPSFVVDEVVIEKNLKILHDIKTRSGAKILSALKAFSMYSLAPLINKYLDGTCSSGINEALLANEF